MNKYITIGKCDFFRQNKTYIMGILNMTPDSFSDGGSYDSVASAMRRVEEMIRQGADIIDVGGESTRPGHAQISDEEEIARVVPVISAIREHFNIPVSVDTYKSSVAEAAIKAGADLVNDIWGLKYDPNLAHVIKKYGVACCLMHNRRAADAQDIMAAALEDLKETLEIASNAGIDPEKIILDPGIGFGKTYEQNLIVMKHLDRFRELGYPLLLGTSRKSMIGLTLNLPVDERVEGTLTTSVMAVMNDYSFIRVHDIEENYRAVKMAEAIRYVGEPQCSCDRESPCDRESSCKNESLCERESPCESESPCERESSCKSESPCESESLCENRSTCENVSTYVIPKVWHRAYIGLGSNMGDRRRYLDQALALLAEDPHIRRVYCSDIFETKPYGGVAQDDFLNACASLETIKTPRQLLECLNGIEKTLGRERIIHWGPRTIDLDILLFDDIIVDEPDLKIPHTDMQNREFVLKPLAEIAGHVQHPRFHKTIHELYTDLFKGER